MCQCSYNAENVQAARHRRIGLLLGALTAVLGLIPMMFPDWVHSLAMSNGHIGWSQLRWVMIGTQVVLIVLALRQLSLARQLSSNCR